MRTPGRMLSLTTFFVWFVISAVGCSVQPVKTVGDSKGIATVGSREVKYSLEGKGGVFATKKSATIAFSAGEVIVEADRALLDGKEVAKVPADAKVVSVYFASGTLKITADGKTLHEVKLVNKTM